MSPELERLLQQAKAHVDAMTPEEREEMYAQQRYSMAKNYFEGERETAVVVVKQAEAPRVAVGLPSYDQIAAVTGVERDTVKKVALAAMYAGTPPRAPEPDYKAILLALCASLYQCGHMGDVNEEVDRALRVADIRPPAEIDNDNDLADWLAVEHDAESLWALKAPGEA